MAYRKKTMYRRRPAPKKKGGVVKRAIRKARKQVFAKRVKAVVNRMAETKMSSWRSSHVYGVPDPAVYIAGMPVVSTASADHDKYIVELVPGDGTTTHSTLVIGQGDGQGTRTGNEITTVKATLSGVVRFNTSYNTLTGYKMCPIYVTMWIVTLQKHLNDTLQSLETTIQNSFFQDGDSSFGFEGTMNDLVKKPNSSVVRVLKKRTFKLGTTEVYSATGSAQGDNGNQRWVNNDFGLAKMFRIDLTKIIPKKFKFNDIIDIQLNNRRRWLFFSVARADGRAPLTDGNSTTGPIPAYVHLNFDYCYKDM